MRAHSFARFSPVVLLLAACSSSSDSKTTKPLTGTGGSPAVATDSGKASTWTQLAFDNSSTYLNPNETKLSAANVANLKEAWKFEATGGVTGATAVVGNTAYVVAGAAVYAFDVSTGKVIWTNEDVGSTSSPTYENGILYVDATMPGESLYALDAKTGKEIWHGVIETIAGATGFSSPVVTDNLVVVGDSSYQEASVANNATFMGSVVAFDKKTGKETWRFHTVDAPYNGCAVWSTVSVDPDTKTVFAVTGNNYTELAGPTSDSVFALDLATGTKKWQTQASTGDVYTILNMKSKDSDFGANPILFEAVVEGGLRKLVGLGQKAGVFWAFDRETGKVVWQRPLGPGSAVGGVLNNGAYDGKHIYVASNGAESSDPGSEPSNGDTIGSVGSSVLFSLDPGTGDIVWERQLPAYVWAPITIANGVGYVAAEETLEAFDLATGAKLFATKSTGTIASAPVVVDGRVFFGTGMSLVVYGHQDDFYHVLSL